jgi:hypothetical protein
MSEEKEKLVIKVGENFEANATGRLAIVIVFAVFCIAVYMAMI